MEIRLPVINRVQEEGPSEFPVRIIAEVFRHAQKGDDGISLGGAISAAELGADLRHERRFTGFPIIKGYSSQMPRGIQTLEAIFKGMFPARNYEKRSIRPLLLGFGTAGGDDTFWGVEGQRLQEAITACENDTNPQKPRLTVDELEAPIIKKWIDHEDKELSKLLDPVDAAADAAIALGRVIGSLSLIDQKNPPVPLVRRDVGILAVTHRGAFEPLLASGVLLDISGYPVTDITKLGGPSKLLGGFRLDARRGHNGRIRANMTFSHVGKLDEVKTFTVNLKYLNNLYTLGVERLRQRRSGLIP